MYRFRFVTMINVAVCLATCCSILIVMIADRIAIDGETTDVECFTVNNNKRQCLFRSINWRTEWTQSQAFCKEHNGNIVSIDSSQIQMLVEDYIIAAQFANHVWIGAVMKNDPDTWLSDLSEIYDGDKITNQAQAADYRTHAVIIRLSDGSFEISARHPNDELSFICQYPAGSVKCRESKSAFDMEGRCYVPQSNGISTWYQARNKCLRERGDLAAFVDVNGVPTKSILQSTPYWILLRNTYWTWPNGNEVLFTNWGPGQPTDHAKLCVMLDSGKPWKWATANCDDKLNFVCQNDEQAEDRYPVCEQCSTAFICMTLAALIAIAWYYRRRIVVRCCRNTHRHS